MITPYPPSRTKAKSERRIARLLRVSYLDIIAPGAKPRCRTILPQVLQAQGRYPAKMPARSPDENVLVTPPESVTVMVPFGLRVTTTPPLSSMDTTVAPSKEAVVILVKLGVKKIDAGTVV